MRDVNPYIVACPRCGAAPHTYCIGIGSYREGLGYLAHRERSEAAAAAAQAAGHGYILSVGQPYPARLPASVQYNYRAGGHELLMVLDRVTEQEIDAVSHGPAEFALYVKGPVIELLYQFAPAFPWSDAPYSWHRLLPGDQSLPTGEPGHALLLVILVDAGSNLVRALRGLTFSQEFTADLEAAILNQAAQPYDQIEYGSNLVRALRGLTFSQEFTAALEAAILNQAAQPYDQIEYDAAVNAIQAGYQPVDLVPLAIARTIGGA